MHPLIRTAALIGLAVFSGLAFSSSALGSPALDQVTKNLTATCHPTGQVEQAQMLSPQDKQRFYKMCAGYYWGLWQCAPYDDLLKAVTQQGDAGGFEVTAQELDPQRFPNPKSTAFNDFVTARANSTAAKKYSTAQFAQRMNAWNIAVSNFLIRKSARGEVATMGDIAGLTRQSDFSHYCP